MTGGVARRRPFWNNVPVQRDQTNLALDNNRSSRHVSRHSSSPSMTGLLASAARRRRFWQKEQKGQKG